MRDELPTIPERVEKGIAWLEEQGAYDWAEKIVASVDAGTFNLQSDCSCAVGTVLVSFDESYRDARELEIGSDAAWAEACRFGFWVDGEGTGLTYKTQDEFRMVEAEWERRAREHAAWRAEVLG